MAFGLPDGTLSSELDAINMVMKAKGLDLVTSADLNDAEIADAAYHLDTADREFQSKGWFFNTDLGLTLPVEASAMIPLPSGCLGVASSYSNWSGFSQRDIVERAGFLYDRDNNTFIFTADQIVDIIIRVNFTDMPEVARRYVATLGAHRAQGLDRGNSTSIQITNQMVQQALAAVEWAQDAAAPNNQVHGNISVQSAINAWGQIRRNRTT
jgi:hypothetical protein